ncbi:MAG: hypothetical protein NZ930_03310 [Candidatus Bipolaricaulota bacterium]|nr:hypothetical protein [Candidatus Bipolaricaulota bacterium]MDW8030691.1 hypothetical protein [Candidatus Bipolaricaulota bacterium]
MIKRVLKRTTQMLIPLGVALGLALMFDISMKVTGDPIRVALVFLWLFLALLGIWAIVTPRGCFMYWARWKLVMYGLTEPPKFVIILTRIGGWVVLILSIIGLIVVLTSQ